MSTSKPSQDRQATDLIQSNFLSDLRARAEAEHAAVVGALKTSLIHAMACGDLLLEAKAQLKHGGWLPWLESAAVPQRTAQKYMRLARNRLAIEEKTPVTADLTIEDALHELARPSMGDDADYLPTQTGRPRLGELLLEGEAPEIFGVIESTGYPGYYHLGHAESFAGTDEGGVITTTRKPVRADGIQEMFEGMTRHRGSLDTIKWFDGSKWSFPSPEERWK